MTAQAPRRTPQSDHGQKLDADDELAALLAELRTEQAERERLRAVYEGLGIGSTAPAFAAATYAYAVADMRCANLEAEIERRRNRGGLARARSGGAS